MGWRDGTEREVGQLVHYEERWTWRLDDGEEQSWEEPWKPPEALVVPVYTATEGHV